MVRLDFLYVIGNGRAVKIGRSASPEARIASLSAASSAPLVTHYVGATNGDAGKIERAAHATLAPFRVNGEWFAVAPAAAFSALQDAARSLGEPLMRCDIAVGDEPTSAAVPADPRGSGPAIMRGHRAIWALRAPLIHKLNLSALRIVIGAVLLVAACALGAFAALGLAFVL